MSSVYIIFVSSGSRDKPATVGSTNSTCIVTHKYLNTHTVHFSTNDVSDDYISLHTRSVVIGKPRIIKLQFKFSL